MMNNTCRILANWNQEGRDSWKITIDGIRVMPVKEDMQYARFFQSLKSIILSAQEFAKLTEADPTLQDISLDDLMAMNKGFFADLDLQPDADGMIPYEHSYGNPDYAVSLHGKEMGQLMSMLYAQFRQYIQYVIKKRYMDLQKLNMLYITLHNHSLNNRANYEHWLDLMRLILIEDIDKQQLSDLYWRYCSESTYYKDIILKTDLTDLRYLYRYGIHISENDLAMARFMLSYPEAELQSLSQYIVKSYLDGFIHGNRDYFKKKYVNLIIPAGMEKLGRYLVEDLYSKGLYAVVQQPVSKGINKQFGYDHRFDNALYLDQAYTERVFPAYEKAVKQLGYVLNLHAGPIYVDLFGEVPFAPANKDTALKLSEAQQLLARKLSAKNSQIFYEQYIQEETSFCIIAFPAPSIGDKFEQIFADTVKINLLDSDLYARIQQNIIDVLDKAEFVHVKGKPGNDTDIMVKLHTLANPAMETNFENCVADVNIPVGEVFTSPLLKGTNGTIHVEDIYLRGLRFFNLKITFKDGWVNSYSCTNFEDANANQKYIAENLLQPHKSLPIGEFAIGTNTTAYQIAKKHDILPLLPILIIEKMGPHFAIGDTCYSREEDADHFCLISGKKIIAVENEKSATRKTDPLNAYMQAHTDITLPYEMLESIAAVTADGKRLDIIRDGLFAVPGTEELNIPLLEMR